MEEAVNSRTRSENYRRMVKNINTLATELLWSDANNFDKRIVVNFHSQTL
jgi:hypothetical protein